AQAGGPIPFQTSGTGNLPSKDVCSSSVFQAEFLRLSLGFKCDLFTLEKRVRLEERSRDLAEGSLRKEITGALKLLDSLASLSEDNQVQEIVKKLQKSLDLLNQHATRIASKAEMLGAVHQESRVSKAVEVMIQHVENLKRTYAREHAELEELKELLLQNEKSFSSLGDRGGRICNEKKTRRNFFFKESLFDSPVLRSLKGTKQGEKRPSLQRLISSTSWTESEEEQLELECTRVSSWASALKTSFSGISKALCVSIVAVVLFAVLITFVMGFSFHQPVEASPQGTGTAWTSVQKLLWPYTRLLHHGPPPV
uniref:Inositol 1,4,5-triphosphate receptor associated 2 n=1 Tax=Pseudonaja textilis TaxID=8673 RepID=A0A670XNM2_PSETE